MISRKTREQWSSRIKYCIENQSGLTDWELGFIESLNSMRCFKDNELNMDLSLKQSYKLGEIYHRLEEGR